jgi:hypothetical protein
MTSDLDRLLRAVRTLAKIARTYDAEHLLDVLGQYATLKQEGELRFVGTFLDDIGEELYKRSGDPVPHCQQCDKEICDDVRYDDRDPRADAQYCGPACRQKAYRDRVKAKAKKHKPKRNENDGNRHFVSAKAAKAEARRNAAAAALKAISDCAFREAAE